MRVTFVVNELRPRDDALADRVESEVREAAADVASEEAVLRCRVQPHGTPLAGFAVHLEGPHWYGSFEVSSPAVPGEVRLAVRRTLRDHGVL